MDLPSLEQHDDARFAVNHTEHGGIQVNRAAQIMTADTHKSFLHAGEMLKQAQHLADKTMATAEAGYQAACDRGYLDGLEQARAQITSENVEVAAQRRRHLESMERDISALVLQTLRQMLGEIDRAERICLMVREALTRLGQSHGEVILHVHPELGEEVSNRMSQWHRAHQSAPRQSTSCQSSPFKVMTDPALARDACRVACISGTVAGNVWQQLAALESALGLAADAPPQNVDKTMIPGTPPC